MKDLLRMINSMIENGGDYDLLCVKGLIEDRFLNESESEKENFAIGFLNYYGELPLNKVENISTVELLENYKKTL
jgi:hypothetical protein